MLKKINPSNTKSWEKLECHYEIMKNKHMKNLFSEDKDRFNKFSIRFNDIFLDYSKNIITEETIKLLVELAHEIDLKDAVRKMFNGYKINESENRAALHTALRNRANIPIMVDGINIMPGINEELEKIKLFSEKIRSGEWKGYTGKTITDIVNIGVGGSDLGPLMVTNALEFYGTDKLKLHFVSNVDAVHISTTLKNINPETTLFIIVSKSFNTQETLTNAMTARKWFLKSGTEKKHTTNHFIAVSGNKEGVKDFGITAENMFNLWDFVGGRYSIWSAVGLSVACYIGFNNFVEMLEGAHEMDEHFKNAEFEKNIPVILALIGIWYTNFFNAETEAILPYDQCLDKFPAYLQQAHMESNGKNIDREGNEVEYQTCPIIWGEPGTNGQHSFYQLIHQGTKLIPADFLAPVFPINDVGEHHYILLSNFFAQTKALMNGKTKEEVLAELKMKGFDDEQVKRILPFKLHKGNKPTNSILYKKLTPKNLGSLIAMYEHKIFVQGVIWNIFSFDQWGVEFGKELAKKILPTLQDNEPLNSNDSSTNGLIRQFKKMRNE